jgi:hypothetical protein
MAGVEGRAEFGGHA